MKNIIKMLIVSIMLSYSGNIVSAKKYSRNGKTWWQQEKIRILVDKIFSRNKNGAVSDSDFKVIKNMGFNVLSTKWSSCNKKKLSRDAEMCKKNGMYYLPWMRGTLRNIEHEAHKLVWGNGVVQDIYSPNSPYLWKYLEQWLIYQAKLSREYPVVGVLFDFEIYGKNKQAHAYYFSYDLYTVKEYCKERGIEKDFANISTAKCVSFAKTLGKDFGNWQAGKWRQNAKRLREKIDAINPDFMFFLYMGSTPFFHEVAPEWSTNKAPMVICGSSTYGKPAILTEKNALLSHVKIVQKAKAFWNKKEYPCLYLGGIDPAVHGSDPEFSGKNAVTISRYGDGYWVFFEGYRRGNPKVEEYINWFTRANKDITSGTYQLPDLPRQTPELEEKIKAGSKAVKQIAIFGGMRGVLTKFFQDTPGFEPHKLKGYTLDYFKQFDLIILQGSKVPDAAKTSMHKMLQQYVKEGGSLLLTYTTVAGIGSPFPEIVAGPANIQGKVKKKGKYCVRDKLRTRAGNHPVLEGISESFYVYYQYHVPMLSGSKGSVLTKDAFGKAVLVSGEYGKGRVAFMGDFLGRRKDGTPKGMEKKLLMNLCKWLVRLPENN